MMPITKNILVAVDFSDVSKRALAYAEGLAASLHATLHLVHTVPDPYADPWLPEVTDLDLETVSKGWKEDATRRLTSIKPERIPTEVSTQSGRPAAALMQYAADHKVDVIVVGTHGRRRIEYAFMDSVAERLVRKAPCPVLTVR